jgi:DNA-binding transcriptional LysR family regulator
MSRDAFNSLKHIDIEIAQGWPGTGYRLAQPIWLRQGLRREVALCVPSFTAALMAAARTEYIATVPRRTAQVFCKMLPLKIVEVDFELPVIRMALTWHARTNADEGSRYFRKLVLQCLRDRDS